MTNEILSKILKKDVEQAEVYLAKTSTLKIDVLNHRVEAIDEIRDQGLGIRVIKNKRLGFAFTSEFDETVLKDIIDQAIINTQNSAPDQYNLLPPPQGSAQKLDGLYDPQIPATLLSRKIELALQIEESARAADQRILKTEKISYSDTAEEIWVVNSHGLSSHHQSNQCGAIAEVIAEENGEMESGFGLDFVKSLSALQPAKIGQEAAQRAIELLGAKSLSSQRLPLIFDQLTGSELLELIAGLLSAEAVQKGKSLFAGKIDQPVASKLITLVDNGRLAGGLATTPFDSEGVPTQETSLIENGILQQYLHNTYTATKGGSRSSGNAVRSSFKQLPGIGPTNFYLKPGDRTPDSLISSLDKGLFITRLMGLHTANPISGDFSLGAAGLMIKNGQKTFPVRGITIAGNLLELLKTIEAVGTDLRFFQGIGSPSFLVSGLSLSGG